MPAQVHGLLMTMDFAELRMFVGGEFVPSTRILHCRICGWTVSGVFPNLNDSVL